MISYTYFPVHLSFGSFIIGMKDGDVAVVWKRENEKTFLTWFRAHINTVPTLTGMNKSVVEALKTLWDGKDAHVSLYIDYLPTFQKSVLHVVASIPSGKTMTYSQVAQALHKPKAYRVVAHAVAQNPIPLFIPCHRVVRSDGTIGEYAWGKDIKKRLLKKESV